MREDFEKYLTEEEREEIARGLARGEEDIKAGRVISFEELKERIRRLKEDYIEKRKAKLHN
ncbi:MAG: hypothetical protein IJ867_07080 [Clostridia bacterium]|nr:hypothetical protein [Clostridia bacterium]